MKRVLLALTLVFPRFANAGALTGVFRAKPEDTGGFLHVGMANGVTVKSGFRIAIRPTIQKCR